MAMKVRERSSCSVWPDAGLPGMSGKAARGAGLCSVMWRAGGLWGFGVFVPAGAVFLIGFEQVVGYGRKVVEDDGFGGQAAIFKGFFAFAA